MKELYCFELYKNYTIVVEYKEYHEKQYEGIAYKHSHHNPEYIGYDKDGEALLNYLKKRVDDGILGTV